MKSKLLAIIAVVAIIIIAATELATPLYAQTIRIEGETKGYRYRVMMVPIDVDRYAAIYPVRVGDSTLLFIGRPDSITVMRISDSFTVMWNITKSFSPPVYFVFDVCGRANVFFSNPDYYYELMLLSIDLDSGSYSMIGTGISLEGHVLLDSLCMDGIEYVFYYNQTDFYTYAAMISNGTVINTVVVAESDWVFTSNGTHIFGVPFIVKGTTIYVFDKDLNIVASVNVTQIVRGVDYVNGYLIAYALYSTIIMDPKTLNRVAEIPLIPLAVIYDNGAVVFVYAEYSGVLGVAINNSAVLIPLLAPFRGTYVIEKGSSYDIYGVVFDLNESGYFAKIELDPVESVATTVVQPVPVVTTETVTTTVARGIEVTPQTIVFAALVFLTVSAVIIAFRARRQTH